MIIQAYIEFQTRVSNQKVKTKILLFINKIRVILVEELVESEEIIKVKIGEVRKKSGY
jgi:hypothetical protein